jgi:hypothetical protein
MLPHVKAYPIVIESGIKLGITDNQFTGSLCTLMIESQAVVDDPLNYLFKNVLPNLANKHLAIRGKFKSIYEYEKKTPKKV